MAEYENINVGAIAYAGVLSVIATFLIIVGLIVYYQHSQSRLVETIDINQPWVEFNTLVAKQEAELQEYRWVDQATDKVTIPVEVAKELVVREVNDGTFDYPTDQTINDEPEGEVEGESETSESEAEAAAEATEQQE